MKKIYTSSLVVMLLLGFLFHVHSLAAIMYLSEDIAVEQPFTKRHFALQDAVAGGNAYYGYTKEPDYPPLEIVESVVPDFEYMAVTPYYKVFFKGTTVKMVVQDAWITFQYLRKYIFLVSWYKTMHLREDYYTKKDVDFIISYGYTGYICGMISCPGWYYRSTTRK